MVTLPQPRGPRRPLDVKSLELFPLDAGLDAWRDEPLETFVAVVVPARREARRPEDAGDLGGDLCGILPGLADLVGYSVERRYSKRRPPMSRRFSRNEAA